MKNTHRRANVLAAIVLGTQSICVGSTQAAPPRLLPFQGRLTDASGTPVADGAKVVQFKIYDAPTGGTAVWSGEVQKLTVNGGLVSTLLGSKADLSGVDFNQAIYLEITVDANSDNQITAADPPLLPRQSILPTVYAAVAGQMQYAVPASGGNPATVASKGWDAVFENGNPDTGKINATKLVEHSVGAGQLSADSVDSAKIVNGAILAEDLSPTLQADSIIPPGVVVPFFGNVPPAGWEMCAGQEVARSGKYARLFAAIGISCGSANSSVFNFPDLRGRFLRGVDSSQGRDPGAPTRTAMSSGGNVGDSPGSLQTQGTRLPSTPFVTNVSGAHSHTFGRRPFASTAGGVTTQGSNTAPEGTFTTGTAGAHSHDVTGGGDNETRPLNAACNYIIKY